MKIANYQVVMREFPGEITLALNISGCPNRCLGCHSQYLWDDVGEEATRNYIYKLIEGNRGITCIGFMGGDGREDVLKDLALTIRSNFPNLKIGWYSGRDTIDVNMCAYFDYVKYGRYDAKFGPLNNPGTNQRMLKCIHCAEFVNVSQCLSNTLITDITYKFWPSKVE